MYCSVLVMFRPGSNSWGVFVLCPFKKVKGGSGRRVRARGGGVGGVGGGRCSVVVRGSTWELRVPSSCQRYGSLSLCAAADKSSGTREAARGHCKVHRRHSQPRYRRFFGSLTPRFIHAPTCPHRGQQAEEQNQGSARNRLWAKRRQKL